MPIELEEALRIGESHGIEFKESTKLLNEVAHAVVAFANAHRCAAGDCTKPCNALGWCRTHGHWSVRLGSLAG